MNSKISASFYKSFFDNANDGILLADLKTKKFYIGNKAVCKMLGYSIKEIQNMSVMDIHPKKDLPYVIGQFERQAAGKPGESILAGDMPTQRKDGSVFYTDISASRVKIDEKMYLMGIFRDITNRREMEQNLKDAKTAASNVLEDLGIEKTKLEIARAKEEAVLFSIGDGLLATDEKGNITLINKTAEKLLGKKKEEIMGKVLSEAIIVEDEKGIPIPFEKRPVSMALATGITTTTTTAGPVYYYVREDKTRFPVAITATPVILDGKIIGTIEVFRDITKEKEIDKAKTEFVSLASHQLRTPTTAINWYSEMLIGEEVGSLNEKQKEYLKEIHYGNQRMIGLVDSLLSISRIELGTIAIQSGPVNLAMISDDILKELQTQINKKELEVKREYENIAPALESDYKLIRIILQNLISNAVEYTPPKGKISIGIKKTDAGAHFEVADSGCGIPQNAQSKIYTKFFRADNASSVKSDGNGLGLYLTKSVVEALDGTISFKSKEGEGTVFSVDIPNRNTAKKN